MDRIVCIIPPQITYWWEPCALTLFCLVLINLLFAWLPNNYCSVGSNCSRVDQGRWGKWLFLIVVSLSIKSKKQVLFQLFGIILFGVRYTIIFLLELCKKLSYLNCSIRNIGSVFVRNIWVCHILLHALLAFQEYWTRAT